MRTASWRGVKRSKNYYDPPSTAKDSAEASPLPKPSSPPLSRSSRPIPQITIGANPSRHLPTMSDSGSSSSGLSELQEGVGLRSDTASHDSADDSDPETEAETERLEISPQKARDNITAQEMAGDGPDGAATPNSESRLPSMRPGLTAQDILGDDGPSSDAEDDVEQDSAAASGNSQIKAPPELAGKKRKRSGSASGLANGLAPGDEPLKKRSSSTRFDRRAQEATKGVLANLRDRNEEAIADSSSADEARDPTEVADDGTPGLTSGLTTSQRRRDMAGAGDPEGSKDDLADLSETAGDDETNLNEPMDEDDGEAEGDGDGDVDEAEAETEATAKTEDELAKKRVAMDALVPIEKLFAVFRDRLFDERWAQLCAELDVLNDPNTTHTDYLAMRQAIDARKEEKVNLEHITLGYKTKALESKILSQRAQIHGQYFQTVRNIREQYMERLNEQFCQIQRERRQWKTKDPHFIYNYDPQRSKQIAYQTAYNKEVSLLSGIAKHVGFPSAPEIHGATADDIDGDLRAMNIQPRPQPVSYSARMASSSRADDAAAEEQFLEKTPWANPQHPAHQHSLALDRKSLDPSVASMATPSNRAVDMHRGFGISGSTIGANSDPPSGFAQSRADTIINGSSPLEQLKRKDAPNAIQQQQSISSDSGNIAAFAHNAGSATITAEKEAFAQKSTNLPVGGAYETSSIFSKQPPETAASNAAFAPLQSSGFGNPGSEPQEQQPGSSNSAQEKSALEPDRYQSPSLDASTTATTDRRFAAPPEGITASVGVARSFGVR